MDRRVFLRKGGIVAGAAAVGGIGYALAGQGGGADPGASSAPGVTLQGGESVTVDCAPGLTVTSGSTTSLSTLPVTTVPATTTTLLGTTTSQPGTTSTSTPSTQPTTTTGLLPGTLNPGPLPSTVGDATLRPGLYWLTGDTVVVGKLVARGGAGEIRIQTRGFRLDFDTKTATTDFVTVLPKGRWSRGAGAYVPGQPAVIAPMAFGVLTGSAYNGGTVPRNLETGLEAEVLNLWSDIVIEGPGDVRWMSTGARNPALGPAITCKGVRFEKLGRQQQLDTDRLTRIGELGRYAAHVHICGDNTRGSLFEDCLVTQFVNHAYVPHASHGITYRRCAAHDGDNDAFWWDSGTVTRDLLIDTCLVAQQRPAAPVDKFGGIRTFSYWLGGTDRNQGLTVVRSGGWGSTGAAQSAVFGWPEEDHGVWSMDDCFGHNVGNDGIFAWQNDHFNHTIQRFTAYNCNNYGVEHGAYENQYLYTDVLTAKCGTAGIGLHSITWFPGDAGDIDPRPSEFRRHRHVGGGTPFQLLKARVQATVPSQKTVVSQANWNGQTDANALKGMITLNNEDGSAGTVDSRLIFQ